MGDECGHLRQFLGAEVAHHLDVVPRRRLTRGVGRDEVSEAQWRTKMGYTTGRDADNHPRPAAAIYARPDYLLTLDGSSQVSADFYAASSTLVSGELGAEFSVAPAGDVDGGEFAAGSIPDNAHRYAGIPT